MNQITHAEFWANDVFDGVAFLASALVPGLGISKLLGGATGAAVQMGNVASKMGRGAKLLNMHKLGKAAKQLKSYRNAAKSGKIDKVTDLKNVFKTKEAAELGEVFQKSARKMTTGATAVYNTVAEAGIEGSGVFKDVKEQLAQRLHKKPFDQLDVKQKKAIEKEAGKAASNVVLANMAILGLPNYLQSKMFFGNGFDATRAMRKTAGKKALSKADVDAIVDNAQKRKRWLDIDKDGFKLKAGLKRGSVGDKVVQSIASEGFFEENVQLAIQDYETRRAVQGKNKDRFVGILSNMVNNLNTTEGQKAIL